jgi:phospholipase C
MGGGVKAVPDIDHVIVLVLENRSFDHMLGFLDHLNPALERLTTDGGFTNPGYGGGPVVPVSPTAKMALPIGPDHSHDGVMEQLALDSAHRPTNQGYVRSLERTGRGLDRSGHAGLIGRIVDGVQRVIGPHPTPVEGLGPLAMLCHPASNVPVLSQLALSFAVCTRWFCSVPGETWPNRNFIHAATSDGETDIEIRPYGNRTIFDALEEHGKTWHIYYEDTPQVWAFPGLWDTPQRHANWFRFHSFLDHVAAGQLPSYSFIEPNHRPPLHLMDEDDDPTAPALSNNQHPENNLVSQAAYATFAGGSDTDFARGEALIATVYEALRSNPPLFERSVLLVTYDEHGGFYDHQPPPTGVPSPGTQQSWRTRLLHLLWRRRAARFDFTMLGPRVPAVVISPYVAPGTVDSTVRDHSSVPRTLRDVFALGPGFLTHRDEWAKPFHTLLSLPFPRRADLPDLSGLTGVAALPATAGAGAQGAPPGEAKPPGGAVPQSYKAFVAQADQVHRRLRRVREDEAVAAPIRATSPMARTAEISDIFAAAADRHRTELQARSVQDATAGA